VRLSLGGCPLLSEKSFHLSEQFWVIIQRADNLQHSSQKTQTDSLIKKDKADIQSFHLDSKPFTQVTYPPGPSMRKANCVIRPPWKDRRRELHILISLGPDLCPQLYGMKIDLAFIM